MSPDPRADLRALTIPARSSNIPRGSLGSRHPHSNSGAGASIDPNGPAGRAAAVLMLFGPSRPPLATTPTHQVSGLDVLLVERAATLRDHPGQVAFPGGRAEPGDQDAAATALREAQEETGLDPSGVEVLGMLDPLPLAVSRHWVTPVLAWWTTPGPVGVIDPAECAAVLHVSVADLLDPHHRATARLDHAGVTVSSPSFLVEEVVIWGFTAGLLDRTFEETGWARPWDRSRSIVIPSPAP